MTIPHFSNCPHSPDGWCLDCGEAMTYFPLPFFFSGAGGGEDSFFGGAVRDNLAARWRSITIFPSVAARISSRAAAVIDRRFPPPAGNIHQRRNASCSSGGRTITNRAKSSLACAIECNGMFRRGIRARLYRLVKFDKLVHRLYSIGGTSC